jgi:pyrroloquinoline quinone biosynthesis protein B
MHVILLGTAAGGGFPQWNCWCPPCRAARRSPERARARTQSSAAVSADGRRWFLLDASPDVREQLARLPGQEPEGVRHVPVEGIVLTDAELDHTLGIPLLREARHLALYSTAAVREVLECDSHLLPTTRAFADVTANELELGAPVALRHRDGSPSGLTAEAWPVEGDPPRFARRDRAGHTVGLTVRDAATGGALAFVPGCGALTPETVAHLADAALVLFDGTCWSDDELIALGVANVTATRLGHVPIAGPQGSLARLAELPSRRTVYTHINNTNPILLEDSAERRAVLEAGLDVGADGMTFAL